VWIILLCSGVFVVDSLLTPNLPAQWVFLSQRTQVDGSVEAGSLQPGPIEAVGRRLANGRVDRSPKGAGTGLQEIRATVDGRSVPVAVCEYAGIPFLQKWLYFSTSTALVTWSKEFGLRGFEFWRFIGFQFCHANLSHLLFNMLALWFFGPIVEQALGRKRFLAFYLTCGIAGAVLYLILNVAGTAAADIFGPGTKLPGFLLNNPNMPLVGASAGIFGVLIAAARYVPNATVLLFFVIPMKLSTLAYGLVAIAVATILFAGLGIKLPFNPLPVENAGGEAAHLGGAMAGWYFARRPHHLGDFFDFLGRFDPWSTTRKARRQAQHHPDQTADIDRILDKIRTKGLGSLSEDERRALRRASDR